MKQLILALGLFIQIVASGSAQNVHKSITPLQEITDATYAEFIENDNYYYQFIIGKKSFEVHRLGKDFSSKGHFFSEKKTEFQNLEFYGSFDDENSLTYVYRSPVLGNNVEFSMAKFDFDANRVFTKRIQINPGPNETFMDYFIDEDALHVFQINSQNELFVYRATFDQIDKRVYQIQSEDKLKKQFQAKKDAQKGVSIVYSDQSNSFYQTASFVKLYPEANSKQLLVFETSDGSVIIDLKNKSNNQRLIPYSDADNIEQANSIVFGEYFIQIALHLDQSISLSIFDFQTGDLMEKFTVNQSNFQSFTEHDLKKYGGRINSSSSDKTFMSWNDFVSSGSKANLTMSVKNIGDDKYDLYIGFFEEVKELSTLLTDINSYGGVFDPTGHFDERRRNGISHILHSGIVIQNDSSLSVEPVTGDTEYETRKKELNQFMERFEGSYLVTSLRDATKENPLLASVYQGKKNRFLIIGF